MALTKMVNGKEVTLTAQEEADKMAEWAANRLKRNAKREKENAFKAKKDAEIAALNDRTTLLAEVNAMNNIPQVKAVVRKLAEIIYSLSKGTIE